MKTSFTFIFVLLTGVAQIQAQELSRKIEIEKRGYKYNGIYLDKYDLQDLLKKNEQAYKMLKPANRNHTAGYLIFAAGLAFVSIPLENMIWKDTENRSQKHNGTYFAIGAGLFGTCIPFFRKSNRQTNSAIELYNSGLSSNLHQQHKPEYKFGFTRTGPGLIVKF